MRKMVVFTMTSGRRMAISAFDVKRVIQHEIRADRVIVVYITWDSQDRGEQTVTVCGTFDDVVSRIEEGH